MKDDKETIGEGGDENEDNGDDEIIDEDDDATIDDDDEESMDKTEEFGRTEIAATADVVDEVDGTGAVLDAGVDVAAIAGDDETDAEG